MPFIAAFIFHSLFLVTTNCSRLTNRALKHCLFMNEVLSSLQTGTSFHENAQKCRGRSGTANENSLKKDSFVYLTEIEKVAELVFKLKLEGNLLEKEKIFLLLKIIKSAPDPCERCFCKGF